MKNVLQLEEIAGLVLGFLAFHYTGYPSWLFWALLLTPDISMLGYLINNKAGAILYNIFHHKGVAIALALTGWYLHADYLLIAGIILFSHSCMDRVFGYGLKYFTGFSDTHLGKIGKDRQREKERI